MSEPLPSIAPADSFQRRPVFRLAQPSRQRYWLHGLLLLLTICTTLIVGSHLQYEFMNGVPPFSSEADIFPVGWVLEQPSRLLLGIPFSLALLGILMCHELGHYLYCVYYGVDATLPYFLPSPLMFGTFGAFIRIRAPIRSRRALFDIGIAGPIAGFVAGCVVLAVSLLLSRPDMAGVRNGEFQLGFPLIFQLMHRAVVHGSAGYVPLEHMLLHPTAIAAWVGMFATALNLLPGGQLDGGHIVYSLAPRLHKWVSRITVVVLLVSCWWWWGWATWAVLLMLSGVRHPRIAAPLPPPRMEAVPIYDASGLPVGAYDPIARWTDAHTDAWAPLGTARRWLAIFAFVMLVLTVVPQPFPGAGAGTWRSEPERQEQAMLLRTR